MGRIWAVTRLTLAEALRTRIAVAFTLFLVLLMALLVGTATGDGTIAGKIQMFMSYSFGVTHLVLCLLVGFLACRLVDHDVKTQRIDSVVTKPIARWQYLVGRWLGVVVFAGALMALSMAFTYALITYYYAPQVERRLAEVQQMSPRPVDQWNAVRTDRKKVQNYILVARQVIKPTFPDFTPLVNAKYEELRKEGRLPEDMEPSKIREELTKIISQTARTVGPKLALRFTFNNVPTPAEGDIRLTLRYKFEPSKVTGADPEHGLSMNTIFGHWYVGALKPSPGRQAYQAFLEQPYQTLHSFDVPVDAVEPDGTLTVIFENLDPRDVAVHFTEKDGMEVLVRVGTFTPNFLRTALISFIPVMFIATLAIFASTWLSFPVAALLTLSTFFVGLAGDYLSQAIGLQWGVEELFKGAFYMVPLKVITYLVLHLIPTLSITSYSDALLDGRLVSWFELGIRAGWMLGLQCGVLTVLGLLIFRRRELGKVII